MANRRKIKAQQDTSTPRTITERPNSEKNKEINELERLFRNMELGSYWKCMKNSASVTMSNLDFYLFISSKFTVLNNISNLAQ